MRIGSLSALIVALVAIVVSVPAALAGPGPVHRGYPMTSTMQRVTGHPMSLARIALVTSYECAQPGCAPVFTAHAQPWS
jgi:hypothetical protein